MLELAGPPMYDDHTIVNGFEASAVVTGVRSTISAMSAFVV
jgi:hypothetical protein